MSRVIDQLAEITSFRDRDTVDATLVVALRDLLQPMVVAIYRSVGEGDKRRWITRAHLARHDRSPSADGLWTPLNSLPAWVDFPARVQALVQQQPVAHPGPPRLQVFPLSEGQDAGGVLEITTDQALDDAASRTVVSILRVYSNFRALLDDSEHDTLTGLLNRKTFDEGFYKLVLPRQATATAWVAPTEQRGGRRLLAPAEHYISVVDIDHFKLVNDRFGHLIGDEVLLLLSRLMRACFRLGDLLYRFGGEEFVVLMRCATEADAHTALQRLCTQVAEHLFPQVGQITISIGYTRLLPGDTPSRAFERADKAVYWVKAHGRNQVCSHARLVARGELAEDAGPEGDIELF